jgi:hypothetical protein
MTASTVDPLGAALNQACWTFINALPEGAHLNGHAFNNLKPCMKAAIETYLAAADDAGPLPVIDPEMIPAKEQA